MKTELEPLFTPWKIGNVEIKNRIVMCPMGGTCLFGFGEPNHWDEEAAKNILKVAENNCGLILPGLVPIHDLLGIKWCYQGTKKFEKLKEFMKEIHKNDCKLFVQISAGCGRSFAVTNSIEKIAKNKVLKTLAKPIVDVDRLTLSCSPNPNRWSDYAESRAATKAEIKEMVDAFAKMSKLCMDAGVDGVEIHAVHEGYLIDQFTLPYANQRTDEYGGSFENRYRFPVEIVQAIKKECGQDFPVAVRYSCVSKTKGFREGALPCEGDDYKEVGRDIEEGIKAAKYLQDAGYDMLDCDNGTYDAWYWCHPPMYMPLNCNFKEAEIIKENVDIPVIVAGRNEPEYAAERIKLGKIDGMGVARQFLADPEWITKLINDDELDIRPCLCCHAGCLNLAKYEGSANHQSLSDSLGMCHCAVNPSSMNSKKYHITPTNNPKHFAVIGGGIGGMETARVLALRGHTVSLYEKSDKLGGVFVPASSFDFKEKDRDLIRWFERQLNKLGVEINLNTEITDLSSIKADDIIIATGAKPRTLNIPGKEKAISAIDYLNDRSLVGDKVVIIGGSLTGSEIAYDLYNQGKTPVIVELQHDLMVGPKMSMANTTYLRDFFKLKGVETHLNTGICEIKDGSVIVKDKAGNQSEIAADSVILCVGYTPEPLSKSHDLVGDCANVGNIMTAIWRAWDVAMKK